MNEAERIRSLCNEADIILDTIEKNTAALLKTAEENIGSETELPEACEELTGYIRGYRSLLSQVRHVSVLRGKALAEAEQIMKNAGNTADEKHG